MNRIVAIIICCIITTAAVPAQMVDTLFYGNTKRLYKNPYGRGFIAGTNGYNDIGKYQRFDAIEEMQVVGAKFWMAVKGVVGSPDSITIVFKHTGYGADYFDSLSGGPGATIASIKTTVAQFDTTKGTVFLLAKPFNVYGGPFSPESLFVGIEWSAAADDSFALFVDSAKQGDKQNRAWEQLTGVGYKYQRFDEPSDFSWLLDADIWIALLYKQGLLSVGKEGSALPQHYALAQNFPNPFNPSTSIGFDLPERSSVRLTIYNALGQEVTTVLNDVLDAGTYTQRFSAVSLPSGIYFCRLEAAAEHDPARSFRSVKRMLLLK